MALRGRKPEPKVSNVVALPVPAGAKPRRRKKADVPPAPETIADCLPAKVEADRRAKWYWDFYVSRSKHLAPSDAPLLGDVCLQLSYLDSLDNELFRLTAEGAPITVRGAVMGMRGPRATEARKGLSELFLTPTTRTRLEDKSGKGSAIDPGEKYFG